MKKLCFAVLTTIFLFTSFSVAFAGKEFSVNDIKGSYGFSYQGEIIGIGPIAAIGVIDSDGEGIISNAVRTINMVGYNYTQTFTCSLTVNTDGTGSAVCPLDDPMPGAPPVETFDIVIEENGSSFRMVSTTSGIIFLGSGTKQ